eukprot:TRINITY_DN27198_c0_g1_i1.p1 TRINITY_DN27198_c0_g1~~TRINITY_DN27198_c0_g1_i1.p1  ORF type:complete len:842 (+),score=164.71 TRINITY_DN27198_c0_g1_i1:144-2669(+)
MPSSMPRRKCSKRSRRQTAARLAIAGAGAFVCAGSRPHAKTCFTLGLPGLSAAGISQLAGRGRGQTSGDSHDSKRGGRAGAKAYVGLCLGSGLAVVASSKSRRQEAKRLLRRAWNIAQNTMVQLTPAGRHWGDLLPPTPAFAALANKLWRRDAKTTDLDSIPEMPEKSKAEQSRPVLRLSKRAVTMPAMPVECHNSDEETQPTQSRRNRRMKSLKGWTPQPLLTPSVSRGLADESTTAESNSSSSSTGKRSGDEELDSLPSLLELGRMFDRIALERGDSIDELMQEAIKELNRRYKAGFHQSDAARLLAIISEGKEGKISRQSFATVVRDLLMTLYRVRSQLSLQQLRVVMASAFDRFDMNCDGTICVDEFAAAIEAFDMKLPAKEIGVLHRFLSPAAASGRTPTLERSDLAAAKAAPPKELEDQCRAAVEGAQEKLAQATGWNGAVKLAERVTSALQEPGCPITRAKRGLAVLTERGQTELLADATELAASVAGMGMVLVHVHLGGADADLTSTVDVAQQIGDAAQSLVGAMGDLFQSGSMGPLLLSGLLGAVKALPSQELVSLSENEALLFARTFHNTDCSQGLFHRLLACGGCHWGIANAGESLDDDGSEIKILVRGKAQLQRGPITEELMPGALLGSLRNSSEQLQADAVEPVTYVAWNKKMLKDYLAAAHDEKLTKLVHQVMQESASGFFRQVSHEASQDSGLHSPLHSPRAPTSPSGWLSPVGAALECQAKRKGLPRCSQLTESLQRVLAKPDAQLREKLDQCCALVWDSLDELVESFEAFVDLAGACTVLAALADSSGSLNPDDLLQLAPLLILLSLSGAQVARKASTLQDAQC